MKHIELFNVHFGYEKGGAPVLAGIEFSVEKGSTLCVAGANGSGKSTLLELIAGTLTPTHGTIVVNGETSEAGGVTHNVGGAKSGGAANAVGMVFQEPDHQLFMPTVCEDVMFGILKKGVQPEAARRAALDALG
ncbi:MAG: ATP-binding cassette domain-containing protein, partial [Spirochaetaceae bacterium]|nr:ATP-binding cassette domain-containing protein [Spirochaetaceae bacterium]